MSVQKLSLDCIEICAGSVHSAFAAAKGGAQRIEFCSNLSIGGTTPSYGQLKRVLLISGLKVFALIRPRDGHFVYSEEELLTMIEDIHMCRQIGVHGLVTGTLNTEGGVDIQANQRLIKAADGLPVVFHRAIDEVLNPLMAMEQIIDLGFVRILTSGGQLTAFKGIDQIQKMVDHSRDRIQIMAGSGINLENIATIVNQTGVRQVHTSASKIKEHEAIRTNGIFWSSDHVVKETSSEIVKQLMDQI